MLWFYSFFLCFFSFSIFLFYCKRVNGSEAICAYLGFNIFIFFVSILSYVLLESSITGDKVFYFFGLSSRELEDAHLLFIGSVFLIGLGYAALDFLVFKGSRYISKEVRLDGLAKFLGYSSVFICVLGCLLLMIAIGIQSVFFRAEYLPVLDQVAFTLGQFLMLGGVFLIGYSFRALPKFLAVAALLFAFLVAFSLATRIFALIPAAIYIGYLLSGARSKPAMSLIVVLLTLIMLPVPLMLRDLKMHGLLEYSSFLIEMGFVGFLAAAFDALHAIALNVSFGVSLTGIVYSEYRMDFATLLISLNPLPGTMAGWYEIADYLRVNQYVPYNFYGEIWSLGFSSAVFLFFAFGAVLKLIQLSAGDKGVVKILMVTFLVLFCVLASQYNTRSSFRMIYYLVFVVALSRVFLIFLLSKGRTS